jgi:hypothetical protein
VILTYFWLTLTCFSPEILIEWESTLKIWKSK